MPGKVQAGFPSGIARKAMPGKVEAGFPSGIAKREI
jgi:hypothetical protein